MEQSITKNLKLVFMPFLTAFFIARIPGNVLKKVLSDKLPSADMSTLTGLLYLYGLAKLSLAVWAVLTAVLYAMFKKQNFDRMMCVYLTVFFCGTGVVSLYLALNALVDPRAMLLSLVLNFGFGWFLTAKRFSPDNV